MKKNHEIKKIAHVANIAEKISTFYVINIGGSSLNIIVRSLSVTSGVIPSLLLSGFMTYYGISLLSKEKRSFWLLLLSTSYLFTITIFNTFSILHFYGKL